MASKRKEADPGPSPVKEAKGESDCSTGDTNQENCRAYTDRVVTTRLPGYALCNDRRFDVVAPSPGLHDMKTDKLFWACIAKVVGNNSATDWVYPGCPDCGVMAGYHTCARHHDDGLQSTLRQFDIVASRFPCAPDMELCVNLCIEPIPAQRDMRNHKTTAKFLPQADVLDTTSYIRVPVMRIELYESRPGFTRGTIIRLCPIPPLVSVFRIIGKRLDQDNYVGSIHIRSIIQHRSICAYAWNRAGDCARDLLYASKTDALVHKVFERLADLKIFGNRLRMFGISPATGLPMLRLMPMRVRVPDYPEIDLRHCKKLTKLVLVGLCLTRVPILSPDVMLHNLELDQNLIELSTDREIYELMRHESISMMINAVSQLRPMLCIMDDRLPWQVNFESNPVLLSSVQTYASKANPNDKTVHPYAGEHTLLQARLLEAVIYGGLAPNVIPDKNEVSQDWYNFLTRGLYDPRLFSLIWIYADEWWIKPIDPDTLPEREIVVQTNEDV